MADPSQGEFLDDFDETNLMTFMDIDLPDAILEDLLEDSEPPTEQSTSIGIEVEPHQLSNEPFKSQQILNPNPDTIFTDLHLNDVTAEPVSLPGLPSLPSESSAVDLYSTNHQSAHSDYEELSDQNCQSKFNDSPSSRPSSSLVILTDPTSWSSSIDRVSTSRSAESLEHEPEFSAGFINYSLLSAQPFRVSRFDYFREFSNLFKEDSNSHASQGQPTLDLDASPGVALPCRTPRGKFSQEDRSQTALTRTMKACLRCKIQKMRVSLRLGAPSISVTLTQKHSARWILRIHWGIASRVQSKSDLRLRTFHACATISRRSLCIVKKKDRAPIGRSDGRIRKSKRSPSGLM